MSQLPLTYTLEVAEFALHVGRVTGHEQLSQAWRMELELQLDPLAMRGDPDDFDPDEIYKASARILMERDGLVRRIQGVVTDVELTASVTGRPEVRMVVEPRFALLRHRRDVRIHRHLSVPEIVTEVCAALGIRVETRLRESYAKRPYCVQWRETDYDYCNRLLEDEGIFYAFTDEDVMVLGDHPDAYQPIGGEAELVLPLRADAGMNLNEDVVHELGTRAGMTPGKVTLRDWNTEHPRLDMDVSHPTAHELGLEWYDYPGEYEEPKEGARKARLHAEAFDRAARASLGASSCGQLVPGGTFMLAGVGRYVVRSVTHDWQRDAEGFTCAFEADEAEITYRPPRTTFVPRIFNPHTAIVTTASPEEDIHCDHFGRAKVHFHWDRLRPYDDDSSHWVPVVQDNTGGSSAIPRKNWEMVVHFLEGDPDRPIILGRVFNGSDGFDEKLPYAKDRSSLKSMTTPTRVGANEIRFDDKVGAERIIVRAIRNQVINVANNQTQVVGTNDSTVVENDEMVSIGSDATWKAGNMLDYAVGASQTWSVGGDRTIEVGGSDVQSIGGNHSLSVTGTHERKVFADENTGAKNLTETIGSNLSEKYQQKLSVEIGTTLGLTIGATYSQTIKLAKTESTVSDRSETIGASQAVDAGQQVKLRADENRVLNVTGSLSATAGEIMTLTGAKQIEQHSLSANWVGGHDVTFRVADDAGNESVVVLQDGVLQITTPQSFKLLVSGAANEGSGTSTQI